MAELDLRRGHPGCSLGHVGFLQLQHVGFSGCGAQALECVGLAMCQVLRLWHTGSPAVANGLGCPAACGILVS